MSERIPIFYEGQDDLVDILATSICSICYNTTSFIDFFILDCGLSNINKKLISSIQNKFKNFSLEFISIDLSPFDGLKGWPIGTNHLDCYARLLIPEIKKNIDRAIYLDSDVIAMDDIAKLWKEDLGQYDLAACPDLGYNTTLFENCTNNLSVNKKHIFANAGVLIMNCKNMRKKNTVNELIKIAKLNNNIMTIIEDILSIYFNNNNYKILNNRYNMQDRKNEINKILNTYITDKYIKYEWNNIVLQHLSPGKPWKSLKNNYNDNDLKLFNIFWFFASMTPFYDGLSKKYFYYTIECQSKVILKRKKTFLLFGFLPLLTYIRTKNNTVIYKLFNFITIFKIKMKL